MPFNKEITKENFHGSSRACYCCFCFVCFFVVVVFLLSFECPSPFKEAQSVQEAVLLVH